MSKKVIVTSGAKGGSGKTFTISQMASYIESEGVPYRAMDLDTENRARGGFQHFVPSALKVDIRTRTGLDVLINDTTTAAEDVILVDMPGGCGKETFGWFDEMHDACRAGGLEFVMVMMVNESPSSVETALVWADALQNRVDYVVALNPLSDERAQFEFWNRAEQAEQFRAAFQPHQIMVPSVFPNVISHLENLGLTLHAVTASDKPPYELAQLATLTRINRWKEQLFRQFNACRSVLLP